MNTAGVGNVRSVRVANPHGLHLRAAASIVNIASSFDANATISRDGRQADAKYVLEIVSLAAQHGAELKLEGTGPEADQLLNALAKFLTDASDEHSSVRVRQRDSDKLGVA